MERHTSGRERTGRVTTTGHALNGMPARKPYTYQGDGTGMTAAEVQERIDAARALIASRRGAADDAMPPFEPFTPGPEWYRELADTEVPGVAALAAVLEPPAPEPARLPARCRRCGYLRAKCGGKH